VKHLAVLDGPSLDTADIAQAEILLDEVFGKVSCEFNDSTHNEFNCISQAESPSQVLARQKHSRPDGDMKMSQDLNSALRFGNPWQRELRANGRLELSSQKSQGALNQSASAPLLSWPLSGNALEFEDLHLEYAFFDATQEPVKSQILQKMHLQPHAHVEPIRGQMGGCNAGMWILRDGSQCFMLKLVRILPAWVGPSRTPESEKFAKLSREHPEMAMDPALSFPCKIFHCLGKNGSMTYDLVVMRCAPGLRFSDFIMQKLHGGQAQDLMFALQLFGTFLADFHNRYNGLQHGDLTPANVFFHESSKTSRSLMLPILRQEIQSFYLMGTASSVA